MNSDLGSCLRLARGLLRLYSLAVASEQRSVADHLLRALERLGKLMDSQFVIPGLGIRFALAK